MIECVVCLKEYPIDDLVEAFITSDAVNLVALITNQQPKPVILRVCQECYDTAPIGVIAK